MDTSANAGPREGGDDCEVIVGGLDDDLPLVGADNAWEASVGVDCEREGREGVREKETGGTGWGSEKEE